jgi:hypothetical protein
MQWDPTQYDDVNLGEDDSPENTYVEVEDNNDSSSNNYDFSGGCTLLKIFQCVETELTAGIPVSESSDSLWHLWFYPNMGSTSEPIHGWCLGGSESSS